MEKVYKENVLSKNVTINDLPEEVLEFILTLIPPYQDLHACMLVSKKWRKCVLNVVQIRKRNFQKAIDSFNVKWQHIRPMEKSIVYQSITKRHSHSAVVCDNFMYVFGGCSTALTTFNDLWKFNLSNYEWTRLITMGRFPSPKACSSLVRYKQSLVLFGGWTYPPSYPLYQHWHLFDELHVYDILANYWTDLSTTKNRPPPLAGHSVSVIGKSMILFGGLSKPHWVVHCEKSNDVWILDLESWEWCHQDVKSVQKPSGRFGQTQVILNDENILILGGCGGPKKEFNDCWILNMPKNSSSWKWIKVQIDGKRYEPSNIWSNPGCKVGDKIVVLNRISRSDEKSVVYFSKNQWKSVPPMNDNDRSARIDSASRKQDIDENINGRRGVFRRNRDALRNAETGSVTSSSNFVLSTLDNVHAPREQQQPREVLEHHQAANTIEKKKGLTVHSKNQNDAQYLGLFVLDISKVLDTENPVATWLPPKNTSTGPEERILYSLVEGKSELIMFGGIDKEVNSADLYTLNNNISNTLHFFTAPSHVI